MLREDQVIGSLSLVRNALAQFSPAAVEILKDFATPSALAIPNAWLFRRSHRFRSFLGRIC
jgi:GAF domain-containing protein